MKNSYLSLLLLYFTLYGCGQGTIYPDSELERHFKLYKSTFAEISNGNSACEIAWKEPAPNCKEILERIDIFSVSYSDKTNQDMVFTYKSFAAHHKGLIYSKRELLPLYDNLDERPPDLQPYQKGYKQIDENWYIFYEYLQ